MRRLLVTSISLILVLHTLPLRPAHGQLPRGESPAAVHPLEGVKYEPVHLPLSAKAARTWITLRETMVKPLPDQTPLAEVMRSLKDATRGKGGKASPLTIYVDPTSLLESEISMKTPIASPFVGQDEVPLHTYLQFILKPFGLTHRVHDGLVIIASPPCCDCPEPVEISAAEAWAWLLLHEEVPLRFPDETALEDVLKTIHKATAGNGPGGRGLMIHLDPVGLAEAEKTPESPVTIEMERVPLCTSLGLVLNQLGLGFYVRDDGVVVITHFTATEEALIMDETDAIQGYQDIRYELFWERKNQKVVEAKQDDQKSQLRHRPRRPSVKQKSPRRSDRRP